MTTAEILDLFCKEFNYDTRSVMNSSHLRGQFDMFFAGFRAGQNATKD